MQPIASLVNSQWPIVAFTLILTLMMFLNNGFKVKKYVVVSLVIISIYYFFSALIYTESTLIILLIFGQFMLKSFSAFMIGSLFIDGEALYDAFLKISIVNFFAIILFPFVDFLDSMNYMRFGYAMAPSVIMFFYAFLNKSNNKFLWILLSSISFLVTIIYGSRGPLIVFLLFGLLLFVYAKRITTLKKFSLSVIIVFAGSIIGKYSLLKKLIDYVYLEIGIQSYALAKLRMMLTKGISESSSGRDEIYGYILSYIKQSPIFGHGIGYAQMTLGFTAHNVFLQILLETGVLGLLIWMGVWVYSLRSYKKMRDSKDRGLFKVTTLVLCLGLGRLLISSDMWLRPEYWLALSMLLNFKYKQKPVEEGMIQ